MKNYRKLLLLLLVGFLLRILISFYNSSGDVNNHLVWATDIVTHGPIGFYDRSFAKYGVINPNYPPLTIILFTLCYLLFLGLKNLAWFLNITVPLFPSNFIFIFEGPQLVSALLKLPAIFADLGIAYFVYRLTKQLTKTKNEKMPLMAASLVLFNPAFFYTSALWGQIESIPLFFILAALDRFFVSNKNDMWIGVLYTLALLTKQTAIVFLPVFIIMLILKSQNTAGEEIHLMSGTGGSKEGLPTAWSVSSSEPWREGIADRIWKLTASVVLFFLFFLPFSPSTNILLYPFLTYWSKILTASASHYATYHAFNLWFLVVGNKLVADSATFLGISFHLWGIILTLICSLIILYFFIKRSITLERTLWASLLISFAFFLFFTRMHERHLASVLPFLLLLAMKKPKLMPTFIFVCFFHLVNLYHGWWVPFIPILVQIFSSLGILKFLTVTTIGIFIYLLIENGGFFRSKQWSRWRSGRAPDTRAA